jgi:hypothetical protein
MDSCYTVGALIDHLKDFPQDAPVFIQSDANSPTRPIAGPFMNPPGFKTCVILIGQLSGSLSEYQAGTSPVERTEPVLAGISGEANQKEKHSIQGGDYDLPAEGIDG